MCPQKSDSLRITPRTKVKRGRLRASYQRDLVYNIIDEALVAYLGLVIEGQPFVMPTSHWRDGNQIYWHGATKGRMTLGAHDQPVCLTLALLDGLVMARSAFHHSVNYRSVMLFGRPRLVTDPEEKTIQLRRFINRLSPGRWEQLRPMHARELKATGIMSMTIDEGSAKLRAAPPADDAADIDWPVWAGVIPVKSSLGEPEPCEDLAADQVPPEIVSW